MAWARTDIHKAFNQYGTWEPDGGKDYHTPDAQRLIDALLALQPDIIGRCPHGCYVTGTSTKIGEHPKLSQED